MCDINLNMRFQHVNLTFKLVSFVLFSVTFFLIYSSIGLIVALLLIISFCEMLTRSPIAIVLMHRELMSEIEDLT